MTYWSPHHPRSYSSVVNEHKHPHLVIISLDLNTTMLDHVLPTEFGPRAWMAVPGIAKALDETTLAEMAMNVRMDAKFFMMAGKGNE